MDPVDVDVGTGDVDLMTLCSSGRRPSVGAVRSSSGAGLRESGNLLGVNPGEMADLTAAENMGESHKVARPQRGIAIAQLTAKLKAKNDSNISFGQVDFDEVAALQLTPDEMAVVVKNMDFSHKKALAINWVLTANQDQLMTWKFFE